MISLSNFLLFLILVTLTTYVFTPWKGMEKGSTSSIGLQFVLWILFFSIIIFGLRKFGLVN